VSQKKRLPIGTRVKVTDPISTRFGEVGIIVDYGRYYDAFIRFDDGKIVIVVGGGYEEA
jgi:hypothetical protein